MEENINTDMLLKFYTVYLRVSREINRLHQGECHKLFTENPILVPRASVSFGQVVGETAAITGYP